MNSLEPAHQTTPQPAVVEKPKKKGWKRFGGKFLIISIAAHLLLGLGATFLIVQTITAKRKLTFKAGPPSPNPSNRATEHKVQMAKKQTSMSAPAQSKRIVSTGVSKISLPEMPAMQMTDNPSAKMAGMGGAGIGTGPIASVMGTGGGSGGSGPTLFGLRTKNVGTLEGTFLDFTKNTDGTTPITFTPGDYTTMLQGFTKRGWVPDSKYKHFQSPVKLYSTHFFFPVTTSKEAGKAFQLADAPDGRWLAQYKGAIGTQEAGTYRFVGYGDNVLFVRSDGRLLLDASDHGYTGVKRESGGNVSFPGKNNNSIFFGPWFDLRPGENKSLEVAVGDEGGIFCIGLFIQKRGMEYKQNSNGVPLLPLFTTGPISDADKKAMSQFLPDVCFTGPVFAPKAGVFGWP